MTGEQLRRAALFLPLTLVMALLLAACPGQEPPAERPMDMPMQGMEDMPMEGMPMDPGMMRRHAEEADDMAGRMREHLAEMRRLSPEQRHDRMGEHAAAVSRMLALMNRQMREMSMGMPMDDEEMGRMMGMSAEEHRRMMEEMHALREEVERLQVASVEALRQEMPGHLERLEGVIAMLEHSAEHMRRM